MNLGPKWLLAAALVTAALRSSGADAIDLSGDWRFVLDPMDLGIAAEPEDWRFPDRIRLPGTVAGQGFGEIPSMKTAWTGDGWRYPEMFKEWQDDGNFKFPFFLQPPRHYIGPAWYQRDIGIPADWGGGDVVLHLERVHWQSTVWIDGREAGKCDSLGTPHEFNLGRLAPGKHVLTLRIDNRLAPVNVGPLSHSVTDHTQGNWNGVVGRMELRCHPVNHIDRVMWFGNTDGSFRIQVSGNARGRLALKAWTSAAVAPDSLMRVHPLAETEVSANGSFDAGLAGKAGFRTEPWSEFTPVLYPLFVEMSVDGKVVDVSRRLVAFREVGSRDGRITINGRKTFLRGTLECCIFPLTGHPPTDVESWKRIVRICKDHGLNHIRFHSWCPPEAAFVAADELGFYYQVEVSSWANQGAEIGSGRPLDEWIEKETRRMLDAYGNHPSFLLMAYGNEPAGGNHPKWLQGWVARRKAEDPRHLHTTGSGWPVMPGSDYHSTPAPRIQQWGEGLKSIINAQAPRTDFDWRDRIAKYGDTPVVSHEIGQWCVYPNFREIGKYTGYFKARNFEIFRETAKRNGLLDQADDFLMASGKLQVLAYKHDIEAALRTPGFGGFQLLDLHDFPGQGTALVGVLDAFWDGKGYVSPEEFRRFCGPVVPLARMSKMVFTNDECLEAEVELAQFGPRDLKGVETNWKLVSDKGDVIAQGVLPVKDLVSGELHHLGSLGVPLGSVKAAARLMLVIECAGFANAWDLFVYPHGTDSPDPSEILITRDLAEARSALGKGRKVLWCPPAASIANDRKRPLVAGFPPVFWNTAWTNWQAPHTLGILCDPGHPALKGFPTETHSNWQWWEVQQGAQPFILTAMPEIRPIVQLIDDWFTNRKLGYVFEARVGEGLLVASAVDLVETKSGPVVSRLRSSILGYMASDRFAPGYAINPEALDSLLKPVPTIAKLLAKAEASSQEEGYEAALAADGDDSTMWHTAFRESSPGPPHTLVLHFKGTVDVKAVLLDQRQDKNPNGQARDVEILNERGKSLARVLIPRDVRGFRIPLTSAVRLDTLSIRIHSSHAGPYGCLAGVDLDAG